LAAAGRFFRWLAVAFSVIMMLGLVFSYLQKIPPGPSLVRATPIASATSLAVLSIGSLIAGDVNQTVRSNVVWRRIGVVLSLASAAFGAVILFVFFANRTDIWGESLAIPAFSEGVILLVLGVTVPLSISRIEGRVIAGQVGALLVFSLTAVIFLGYLYGDPSVGRLFLRPEISFQASIEAVLLAVGIFLFRPASGLLSTASSPGAGGRLLRWFGPIVLLMPALLLLITQIVPSTERVDVLAFVSVGLGLFLLILLSFFVKALDDTAIEAATSAAEAERARTGLEQEAPVVSGMADMFHLVDVDGVEGWEVATRFRPGRGTLAGDSSAVHRLPDGSLGAVLVDLTGHGADPAVWAIRVRDLLLQSLVAGSTPTEAMGLVEWSVPEDVLASAMVVKLDPVTGRVGLCSAGHPPAIVVSAQTASLMSPTGPLLYLEHSLLYEEHIFDMVPGDTLVAFSDGVADVQVEHNGRTEPETLADMLLAEGGQAARTADLVLGFANSEPSDDQTVVVIRRTP
jgi:Stage II sporulation protein E (SpoIIE)